MINFADTSLIPRRSCMNHPQLKEGIKAFKKRYGGDPEIQVFAPCQVNLLGDHEDYNEGYVLSFALPLKTFIVGSKSSSKGESTIHTTAYSEDHTITFDVSPEGLTKTEPKWGNYLKGIILEYLHELPPEISFNAVITSNIPMGYGLGSSVALQVAMATFLEKLCLLNHVTPLHKAIRCYQADVSLSYKFRGMSKHFVSTLAVPGDLLLIDCQAKDYQLIQYLENKPSKPPPVLVVTLCQKKQPNYRSQLSAQARACRDATNSLRAVMPDITSLRSAGLDDLDVVKDQMDDVSVSRAHYIITENSRTLAGVRYLNRFDYAALGEVMNQSHISMKESLEACTDEMNFLIQESLEVPGVLGSKMTGYGSGGCLVTLIERHSSRTLELHLKKRFQEEFHQDCSCYVCPLPGGGTGDCLSTHLIPDLILSSNKRYKPDPISGPEDRGDILTKRLIPVAIGLGICVGIFCGMMLMSENEEEYEH